MLEKNKIYLGDCLEVMKDIEDNSIDMVLCDLPYGMTTCKWDTPIDLDSLWASYERIIKKNGVVVLTASMPFTARLVMHKPKWFRHELIWQKSKGSNFMKANKEPLKSHESVLIFGKSLGTYNPQFTTGKPYTSIVRPGTARAIATNYRNCPRISSINDGKRYPQSIIKFKSETGLHPTQKPVTLFEWLIKTYSNPGDLILDNCSGSGATAVAAIKTGRNYICIEKDLDYYSKSIERIRSIQLPIESLGFQYNTVEKYISKPAAMVAA